MSRSYKKQPYCKDGSQKGTKRRKRFANSRIRNMKDIPSGGAYKKFYDSWDIHDDIERWTWEEAKTYWENNKDLKEQYPTIKDFYRHWLKHFRSK